MLHCTTDPIRGRDRGLRVRVRVRRGRAHLRFAPEGRLGFVDRPRVRLSSITNGETDSDRQTTSTDKKDQTDHDKEMLMIVGVGSRESGGDKGAPVKTRVGISRPRPFCFRSDVRSGLGCSRSGRLITNYLYGALGHLGHNCGSIMYVPFPSAGCRTGN